MRLHRLTLRDVKGVVERTVEFPEHGVVVIEGPNEIGKSTLLEAFDRLLDPRAKATSQSAKVQSLQPVGRDVGPYVEAEFSLGGYRLRFAKQWLRGPATTLEVLAPAREQLSGTAAQERMDAILAQSLDRQLWEALRFTQAGELTQVALTGSGVLTQALDGASGVDLHSADGARLLDRVEREYLRYHTPTGRPGGELKAAMTEANAAQSDTVHTHGRLQETEDLLACHAELEQEYHRLGALRPGLAADLERATGHAEAVQHVIDAHRDAMDRLEQAKERSVRAVEDSRARQLAVQELSQAQRQLADAEHTARTGEAGVILQQRALDALAETFTAAQHDVEDARQVAEQAAADADHLADVAEAEALLRRTEQLGALGAELRDIEVDLRSCPVTTTLLRAVEDAHQDLRVLEAQAQAAGAVLTLASLGAVQSVVVDGVERPLSTGDGDVDLAVHQDVHIEVPGVLRIALRPAAEDRTRAEQLAQARVHCQSLLREAGVQDVSGARDVADRRSGLQSAAGSLRARMAELAAGAEETAAAGARLEALQGQVAAYRAGRRDDCGLPADVRQARAVCRAARTAYEQAGGAAREVEQRFRDADRQLAEGRLQLESHRGALPGQRARVEKDRLELEQARLRVSDEDLEERVADRSGAYARVEAVASEARREMHVADVEGVRQRLERARQALAAHDTRAAEVRDQLLSARAQVEMASGEGRQEAYELALAGFSQARSALEAVHRRARAARQLRQTLGRHRDAAHRAYVRPYAQEIERLGRMVYGETFAVRVQEDLTIAARHLDGTLVPFDQLSGGAKEQLGILARLAVASLVDRDQGVPVIIDDALGYTDPQRLHRVGAVFDGPAQQAQVILLTCTPDRYADIAAATTIRLSA